MVKDKRLKLIGRRFYYKTSPRTGGKYKGKGDVLKMIVTGRVGTEGLTAEVIMVISQYGNSNWRINDKLTVWYQDVVGNAKAARAAARIAGGAE